MSSRPSRPPFDAPEPIMRVAGAWLARRDRGFSAKESAEFDRWLSEDPVHARAAAQLDRTMAIFDNLRDAAPDALDEIDPDAFAPPRRSRRWFFPSLAAAGIAAALALAFWMYSPAPDPTAPSVARYVTAVEGYERATLADGSTIELNGDTVVDVEFTPAERRVRLGRGEAHFQVAKDPARPFVVKASSVAVSAIGTAFNVRMGQTGVEVLVTQGRVRVEPPAPERATPDLPVPPAAEIPLLTAGQKVLIAPDVQLEPARIAAVSPEEIQRTLAWQPRVAEFRKTPLSVVVAEFNRQNHQQIVIRDPSLEGLRIGGNFRADRPEAFVRLLETSFGIMAERSGQTIALRKAGASPEP